MTSGKTPLAESISPNIPIKVLSQNPGESQANQYIETHSKLSVNQPHKLGNSVKTKTMISGLNAWEASEEEHKFGAELRQKNVLVNMIEIVNSFRGKYGKGAFVEDPILKVVAKDYSSYLLNYSHTPGKLAEFAGFYDYENALGFYYSKTDIFIDSHDSLSRAKLTQNLEIALSSILKSKGDALGLLSTSDNCIGVGYALADECISLVLLTYQSPLEFSVVKNNVIGQLIFKGRLTLCEMHIEKISAIDNYSARVIKVMGKNSVKNRKGREFEWVMDPDFEYTMEKSIIQNEKINYGHVTNKGFLVKILLQDGAPVLTLEDDAEDASQQGNGDMSQELLEAQDPSELNLNYSQKSSSHLTGLSVKIPLMNFPSSGDKNFQPLFLKLRRLVAEQEMHFWGDFNLASFQFSRKDQDPEFHPNKSVYQDLHDPMDSSSGSGSYSSFDEDSLSDDYNDFQVNSIHQNPEHRTVKEELLESVKEGREEIRKQREINKELRERAYQIHMKRARLNKSNLEDLSVSQIKYQATLDHIHKVRQQMKICKEQFSKTTNVLNRNLEEKMSAFNDLRRCFVNLKNEISAKAVYSSNYKKISPQLIGDLERAEEDANARLQHARMQVLRLKVDLDRQESELKKKQKFENGLHLIDFEKLKIENQNLNEKMEGKNEELVKLHKKKANTIQILAHTKKKLEYEKQILFDRKLEFEKESKFWSF